MTGSREDGGGTRAAPCAPLRVALVGYGRWGANVARDLDHTEAAALAHIVDVDPAARRRAAVAHPCAAIAPRLADAIDTVDAVAVCTPAVTHARLAFAALEAARHVFVEKPMAMDAADAERLVECAARRRCVLMVGHQLLFHDAFLALRRIVASGELGPLVGIRAQRSGMVDPAREPDVLWAYGPHDVAMILDLAGRPPVRVAAYGASAPREDPLDAVAVEMEFAGGLRAATSLNGRDPSGARRLVAVCARGEVVFDGAGVGRCEVRTGVGARLAGGGAAVDARLPLARELAEFVACARSGRRPVNSGDEGLGVTRVLARAAADLAAGQGATASSFRSSRALS